MYELTVTYADGRQDTATIGTFDELSAAIDAAWETAGFTGYRVGPAK